MNKRLATKYVNYIIDYLEGGYYHPDMKSKLVNGENMLDSGETMFGIDRQNGAPLFSTGTPAAIAFWQLVDDAYSTHHGDTGYYNDKADGRKVAASIGNQLRSYAAQMIIDAFERNAQYLSEGAREIVFDNPRLLLQFLYATYNGPGNFKLFADLVNSAYANGERSALAFWDLVQSARRNRGGQWVKMADGLDLIANTYNIDADASGSGIWLWLLGGGLLLAAITLTSKK